MSDENKKNNNVTPEDVSDEAQEEYKVSVSAADLLADVISDEKNAKKEKTESGKELSDENDDNDGEKDDKKPKKKKEHKKLKHGMMSTVYTVIFVAVIVLVNIVATIIFDKFPITFDLTKNNSYSISEESEKYVKSIDREVSIKVFAEEDTFAALNEYAKQANEVMKRYTRYNSKISVEYINIDSNPDIVGEYADEDIAAYDIIVETAAADENGNPVKDDSGKQIKRIRKVSLLDLIEFSDEFEEQVSNSYGVTADDYVLSQFGDETTAFVYSVYYGVAESSAADQAFMSAFMAVTDPDPVVVTVLTGRNELASLNYFQKLLTANGYTVNTINITTEDIPEDTDLCIIPAPQQDYLEAEIAKVDEYLDNDGKLGKNLMYVASIRQSETPNLDEFLEEYYVEVGAGCIFDSDEEHYYPLTQQSLATMCDDISDNFRQDVITENPQIIFEYSRPVNQLAEEKGKYITEAYLRSTDKAAVVDTATGEELSNGIQNYGVMASQAVFNDDGTTDYSNIFVLGADSMLSDTFLMYNQFQNSEYIMSLINGMTGKTNAGITIEPKVITGNIFDITAAQVKTLKIVFIGVIPAVTLIVGLAVWLRRKNR